MPLPKQTLQADFCGFSPPPLVPGLSVTNPPHQRLSLAALPNQGDLLNFMVFCRGPNGLSQMARGATWPASLALAWARHDAPWAEAGRWAQPFFTTTVTSMDVYGSPDKPPCSIVSLLYRTVSSCCLFQQACFACVHKVRSHSFISQRSACLALCNVKLGLKFNHTQHCVGTR